MSNLGGMKLEKGVRGSVDKAYLERALALGLVKKIRQRGRSP